jgi:hypothetical protein
VEEEVSMVVVLVADTSAAEEASVVVVLVAATSVEVALVRRT